MSEAREAVVPVVGTNDRPLVITHGGCPDGWCAEWLFRRHFGDHADYMGCKHGDQVPAEEAKDRPLVYVADFSWPYEGMLQLAEACGGRLTVLDHHKSAEEALARLQLHAKLFGCGGLRVVFDLAKCGAMLVWEYLKGAGATDRVFSHHETAPAIVRYTQARDLWTWDQPDAKAVCAAMSTYRRTKDVWDELYLCLLSRDGCTRLVTEGLAILCRQEIEVKSTCRRATEWEIAGHKVLVVNTDSNISEVGERLAEGRAFSATYFDDLSRGLRIWSFRSRDGGIDVSVLAKSLGGGGHPRAAGCQQPLDQPAHYLGVIPYHLEGQHKLAC